MTTETTTEAGRNKRKQQYLVLALMQCIDKKKYAELIDEAVSEDKSINMTTLTNCAKMSSVQAWSPVTKGDESEGQVMEFKDLAACDRWIKNNGQDGMIYRPARVADCIEVTTRVETVRTLRPV